MALRYYNGTKESQFQESMARGPNKKRNILSGLCQNPINEKKVKLGRFPIRGSVLTAKTAKSGGGVGSRNSVIPDLRLALGRRPPRSG